MVVSKTTFSNSICSQNLIKILEQPEYQPYTKRVFSVISKFFQYSSGVMLIKDETVRQGTLDLWRKHFLDRLVAIRLPKILETHTSNVIVTQYRKCKAMTRKRDKD